MQNYYFCVIMKRVVPKIIVSLILLTGLLRPAAAQDSLAVRKGETFRWQQLITPTVLMTAGGTASVSPWFDRNVDGPVSEWAGQLRGDDPLFIEGVLQYVPSAMHLFLGLGVPAAHDFKERFTMTATATAAMLAMVYGLKYATRTLRPDGSRANSFPSGHTAMAFLGAEMVRTEYGNAYGAAAYAIAAATGFLRVYNGRHWVSDVVAGAGAGILSARIGYWLLPWERRLFGWDVSPVQAAVLPYGAAGTYGMTLTMHF